MTSRLIDPVVRLLEERIGPDASSIGHDEVGRAVRACALSRHSGAIEQADSPRVEAYYRRLLDEADEWDEFVEHVLVPETWFFREPAAFDLLTRVAAERVTAGRRCRVLSVPCATGEEPYSMAIALDEAGLSFERVTIDAMDISRRALVRAADGHYADRAVRHVGEARLSRYFERDRAGHRVKAEVRTRVTFARGNLIEEGVLTRGARYDVVFCRNVLIYFTQQARASVLASLNEVLLDDGWLVTGHVEVAGVVAPRFVSARVARTFAYRKASDASTPNVPAVRGEVAGGVQGSSTARTSSLRTPKRAGSEPSKSAGGVTPALPDRVAGTLEEAQALADAGALEQAAATCREYLRVNPSAADGYYLLGVIESARGERDAAEHALRRAIYLEPRHVEALRHLSHERQRAGDSREAALLARRAEMARSKQ